MDGCDCNKKEEGRWLKVGVGRCRAEKDGNKENNRIEII
jgi:hypothetical protein